MSYVLKVSSRPYSYNNLANHGRPNRFIPTKRSDMCVCERGGGSGIKVKPILITYFAVLLYLNIPLVRFTTYSVAMAILYCDLPHIYPLFLYAPMPSPSLNPAGTALSPVWSHSGQHLSVNGGGGRRVWGGRCWYLCVLGRNHAAEESHPRHPR